MISDNFDKFLQQIVDGFVRESNNQNSEFRTPILVRFGFANIEIESIESGASLIINRGCRVIQEQNLIRCNEQKDHGRELVSFATARRTLQA
jgi:hypothetical protein